MRYNEREIFDCYKQVRINERKKFIKENNGMLDTSNQSAPTSDSYEQAADQINSIMGNSLNEGSPAYALWNIVSEIWADYEDDIMERFHSNYQGGRGEEPPPMANPDDGIEGDSGEFESEADEPPPGSTPDF